MTAGHLQFLDTADPGKPSRAAFVSMLESAHFGQLNHSPKFWRLYTPRNRCVLFQGKMRACPLVVFEI
jgi:hypothetical protein